MGAETLNYKIYSYVTKAESVPVGDVEGHTMGFQTRRAFCVFENGEVATQSSVMYSDSIKGSGPSLQYSTHDFLRWFYYYYEGASYSDRDSPRVIGAKMTREIIKGTGRFEGIKGTGTG